MQKAILLLIIFSLFKCNNKTSNIKEKRVQIDSTYFVNLYYYGNVTIDSLERKSFLISRNSKYITQLKFLDNNKTFLDSFFLEKKFKKFKSHILNLKLENLDSLYWDYESEGKVRQLIFYDKFKKPIKRIRFVGYPKKKNSLIKSIDSFITTAPLLRPKPQLAHE